MSKKTVYVYDGEGASEAWEEHLLSSLVKTVDPEKHSVLYITPEEIKQGSWTRDAALIALGGGYDRGFLHALGDDGAKNIREFVNSGGAYLGTGAGGYFGCDQIVFDKGGPLEVIGPRPLKFFPGTCRGPVYPGFQYGTFKGAVAAPVDFFLSQTDTISLENFTNGGGYFIESVGEGNCRSVDVLVRYTGITDEPVAAVKCSVGNGGVAVLTETQFECNSYSLQSSDIYVAKFIDQLEESEQKRKECFKSILRHLKISCKI